MHNTQTLAAVWTVDQKVDFFCYMVRRFPRPAPWSQIVAVEWNDGDKYPSWATYGYVVTPDTFKAHRHE